MCGTCGCGQHEHEHEHEHDEVPRVIEVERRLLAQNDRLAARNRLWLEERQILALNFIGSPGAGKTALLERLYSMLPSASSMTVLEGDQATDNDARRLRRLGCRVEQINTGTGCHLDASMIANHVEQLPLASGSLLAIENVGNLVCPSLFDLGERAKLVVMSTTEGEDKPLKYPHIFRASKVLVVTKSDLLPHLRFNLRQCLTSARAVNPALRVFVVSAQTGDGMDALCAWLDAEIAAVGALGCGAAKRGPADADPVGAER